MKISLVYLGIMASLAILGLVFYYGAYSWGFELVIVSVPPFAPSDVYEITIAFFWILSAFSLIAMLLLGKKLRVGAYLAFVVLALSLLGPYDTQSGTAPFTIIWWLALPNVMVASLLLRSLDTLSPTFAGTLVTTK